MIMKTIYFLLALLFSLQLKAQTNVMDFESIRIGLIYDRAEDAKEVFRMRANSRVNQFIGRENMETEKSAEELIERTLQAYQNKQAIAWAGYHPELNQIIGTCGLMHIEAIVLLLYQQKVLFGQLLFLPISFQQQIFLQPKG